MRNAMETSVLPSFAGRSDHVQIPWPSTSLPRSSAAFLRENNTIHYAFQDATCCSPRCDDKTGYEAEVHARLPSANLQVDPRCHLAYHTSVLEWLTLVLLYFDRS